MAGRPTKFTEPVRAKILEALTIGMPREHAARLAGISPDSLKRWLSRGKALPEDSTSGFRKFYDEVQSAEVHIDGRAMGIIYREMDSQPQLAKWILERRVSRYAPPVAASPAPQQAMIINLNLADGAPSMAGTTFIEVPEHVQQEEPEVRALRDTAD